MKRHALVTLTILALAGSAIAAPVAPPAGLAAIGARDLDQVYLRPEANLAGYRRVMIDPVEVQYNKDWFDHLNDSRRAPYVRQGDVRRFADETAASLGSILAAAFKARGYEVVATPGAGTLRLRPRITELRVNALELLPPGVTRSFTRDDAGEATLVLEAHDAGTGTQLGLVVDHGTARTTPRFTQATTVSNHFWLDTMYRRWAAGVVAAFEARKG